ncbi:Zn-ribbon domain-containing OB-fold protein [Mycolicibacterium hippocampi]|uniref:Zn-ribbon domain-containing OB-fold protein n=1 Tax=Mycolicibacterium hippocampi TaxID=659824 RepID=UPI0013D03689|nr:OB-fold domain-containing protein [Mycolicibacterium hippocampi]
MAPLPVTNDPDTAGFWLAAQRGEVAVCVCANCGAVLHLPRSYCHSCRSWTTEWKVVAPWARLVSWTVAEHQVHAAFPVPYTFVLVELDGAPGVRLGGYIAGRPDLRVDSRMRAHFVTTSDDVTLVNWIPNDGSVLGEAVMQRTI